MSAPARHGRRAVPVARPLPGRANQAARALWGIVRLFLFAPSPRLLHGWRRWLLRRFGATVGPGAKPYPGIRVWAPWNLAMGAGSVMGDGVDCYNVDRIALGAGAVVSQRAFLCSASHDIDDPGFALVTAPIVIGPGAWVGAEAFVGPGVTVEEGAVVAARAVVTRNVPAWRVVAGNPAVEIRTRAGSP